jgi:hypothetical protein
VSLFLSLPPLVPITPFILSPLLLILLNSLYYWFLLRQIAYILCCSAKIASCLL